MTDLLHSPDQHQQVLRSCKRGRYDHAYNDIGEDNDEYDNNNTWNEERNGLRDISDDYYTSNHRMKRSKYYDDYNSIDASPSTVDDLLINSNFDNNNVGKKTKNRSRCDNEEENLEPQQHRYVLSGDRYSEKRIRRDRNEDTIVNAARSEELEKRTIEVQELQKQIAELNGQLEKAYSDLKVYDEENKLLKKAVAIQNSREQRINEQHTQYQNIMHQASIHISNLQKENSELRVQLLLDEPYIGTLEHRPPDVF